MSLKILSKNYRPWAYFLSGTPKDFLIGNVGDALLHEVQFSAAVKINYTQSSQLIISKSTDSLGQVASSLVNTDATNWNEEGFAAGDRVTIVYEQVTAGVGTQQAGSGTVQQILEDEMIVLWDIALFNNLNAIAPQITQDTSGNDEGVRNVYIYSNKPPASILLKYFNTLNSNPTATGSYIDGSDATMKFDSVPTVINSSSNGVFVGDQSGASVFASIINITVKPTIRLNAIQGNEYFYTVTFSSFIPFFATQSEYASGTAPSEFLSNECLTDRVIIEARPEKNNPNVTMRTENEIRTQGNTGWFNETYNGNLSAKTATISYADAATGSPLSALNSVGETDVTITISGLTAFSGQYAIGVAIVPADVSEISNNGAPFHSNVRLNYDNIGGVNGGISTAYKSGFGTSALILTRKSHARQVGTDLVLKTSILPDNNLITELQTAADEGKKYIIYAIADSGYLDAADSDRETLLCDYNTFAEYSPSAGAWGHDLNILNRNQATTESQADCGFDLKIEDTFIFKAAFLVGSDIPTLLNFRVIAYNSSTGQQYDLEKTSIDLTQFPTVGGVPQFNYTALRGFKTNESKLNNVSISRNAPADTGGQYAYTSLYPIKIRWEDWLSRLNVPSYFYDTSKPNNGLNNNWYHYLSVAGWGVKLVIDTYVGTTRYEDSVNLGFNDYDDNADISHAFAYYRDSDNTLLNGGTDTATGTPLGVILEEDTRLEITYTRSAGTWTAGDVANLYSVVMIEIENGAGFLSQHEISTEAAPITASPLQPVATESDLKLEFISTTEIKATCLIKPALLEQANRYKITARLGCK